MQVKTLVLGAVQTNCYILTSDSAPGRALVIDPAASAKDIFAYLQKNALTLDAILLTHTHFDHMEALDELIALTGAPFYCPEKDAGGLTDFITNGSMLLFRYPVIVNIKPTRLLRSGDHIGFGKEKLTVLETPGHTVGSVCYDGGDILFSGDTLFCQGYGRTDLPGVRDDELFSSLKRIFALPDKTVYPGHGQTTTIANERRYFGA